jgi:eukaryotic-like serine/threonine-protein kinase
MPEPTTPPEPDPAVASDAAQSTGDSEMLTTLMTSRTTAKLSSPAAPAIPEIPGFTILDQIGRGGMGIVYRAKQHSPERIVALKLIRRDWLDSHGPDAQVSAIGRFRTEADAAARFEHNHIVPIYQVGQAGDQDYYVMRFVDGESLSDLLRNGPLDNHQAALWLEQVAGAVEAAHRHGILHRDLKPQNIMIDRPTQRALVTDFGLAKFTQQEQSQTRTGEILGTPAYMSPEQSRDASQAGAPADIYSLGATLYHTLTARPPFQAAHLVETLRQIAEVEPVSPRQINPEVDRDLETICLK